MAKSRTYRVKKKDNTGTYVIVGGALLGLYLITQPGSGGGGGDGGGTPDPTIIPGKDTIIPGKDTTTYLEKVINNWITTPVAQMGTGLAEIPYAATVGAAKKAITMSEERTSSEVFGNLKKGGPGTSGVSTFLDPAGKRGTTYGEALDYNQWIQQQPAGFRAASGISNIVTNQDAARWGQSSAEATKKSIAINQGISENAVSERFNTLAPGQQILVGLGQAISTPFISGGFAGLGSKVEPSGSSWFGRLFG